MNVSDELEPSIFVDRKFLETADFNTLYTQIISHINYASEALAWGYNMTDMIAKQLELSNDPNYVAKFKALAKQFEQLK